MPFEGYTASDYKRHLEVFLDYVVHNSDIEAGCYSICRHASGVLKRIKDLTDDQNWALDIGPWWIPISREDDNFRTRGATAILGGRIKVVDSKLDTLSFSVGILLNPPRQTDELTCCDHRHRSGYRMARLFRFEVEEGSVETSKPYSHMHYGGRQIPVLCHHCLEDWIEKPRLPFPPLDFVLLLELLARQFELGIAKKLFKEPFWSSCIRKSEEMFLGRYYRGIYRHFVTGEKGTLLERLCSSI